MGRRVTDERVASWTRWEAASLSRCGLISERRDRARIETRCVCCNILKIGLDETRKSDKKMDTLGFLHDQFNFVNDNN